MLHAESRELQPSLQGIEQDSYRNQYHHRANHTVDDPQPSFLKPVADLIDEIGQAEPPRHSPANQSQIAHDLMKMASWHDEDELSEKRDEEEDNGRVAYGDDESCDEIMNQ